MYKVDYQDLSQQVYDTLKHMVLSGHLKPGQKLRQDELAQELGVSRTPLLSAFSKLEKELLVETIPRRGSFVRKYTSDELVHIYEIRVRLEPLGAEQAVRNGTDQEIQELVDHCIRFKELANVDPESGNLKEEDYFFHMRIMRMSSNELLYNIISSYNIIVVANFYGFFKDPRQSAAEHEKIVDRIRARDADGANQAMLDHLSSSYSHLQRHLEEIKARIDGSN